MCGSFGFRLLFYNLDVAKQQPPPARRDPDSDSGPRGGGGVFPSSNGQDGGLSSRQCRFNSGRERHFFISL